MDANEEWACKWHIWKFRALRMRTNDGLGLCVEPAFGWPRPASLLDSGSLALTRVQEQFWGRNPPVEHLSQSRLQECAEEVILQRAAGACSRARAGQSNARPHSC